MSYVQVWLHAVWGTKNREPLLTGELVTRVCDHIKENSKQKGFYIIEVNAVVDHVHCLMALKSDWSVAKQMQMIKGEAAFWINKQALLRKRFEWADEYFASSVSKSNLNSVRSYIQNQQEHHRKISFREEYESFLKKLGCSQG